MTVFLDALLRWHDATFACVVLRVGLLVVRVYRETHRIYGIPASGEAPAETEGSYRVEPPRTFSPYHAAYLINPAVLPGTVALAPLFSMGVLSIDLSTRRIVHGRATPPLDPFQSRAREQAHGVHSDELVRTLSTQMRAELAEDLRGSALQAPGDAPSVPRAATGALWLACAGLCAAALGLGGVFGGGVSAILLVATYRAHRKRSIAPNVSLSVAGAQALRQCERQLDARIRGQEGEDYSPEDIAWYVALKPLPYGRLPGLDSHFCPIVEDAPADGPTPSLGDKMPKAKLRNAALANRFRAFLVLGLGAAVCTVGLAILSRAPSSAIVWINGGLAGVVAVWGSVGV